ncbi:hypothetical protein NIE88_16385 [Sporolactobacillus shoreicorticis]|uniref:Transposase n=1 Tax=Sporolactobacillus shoreicorticis TaxID=1923877 RepID=A0ABW5S4G5_9BACL|nr:hypothetical protein [Sporolactobacillus shoreicorticis]MCO7127349.1 hypothetical protein [Sporolactobacillus shoreicorticis]
MDRQLLRNGLIESSFVPPGTLRNLRDLTRYRRKLLQMSTEQKSRIHNVLQDANIKLTSYMSDVFGVSGCILLEAIMNGKSLTGSFSCKNKAKNESSSAFGCPERENPATLLTNDSSAI